MTEPVQNRYWLQYGDEPEREVSEQEWIAAERDAGFHGPAGKPATAGFSTSIGNLRGRMQLVRQEPT